MRFVFFLKKMKNICNRNDGKTGRTPSAESKYFFSSTLITSLDEREARCSVATTNTSNARCAPFVANDKFRKLADFEQRRHERHALVSFRRKCKRNHTPPSADACNRSKTTTTDRWIDFVPKHVERGPRVQNLADVVQSTR